MKKNYFITLLLTISFSFFSQAQVIITEIADPNNDATARFVEIYNAGSSAVDLTGWELRRWTNGNTDPQSTGVDLTPIGSLNAGSFALIAANKTGFEAAFSGITADIYAGTGGAADSNGDDQIAIFDDSDNTIDIFGVPGEDGSGTCHEFEDGRAERKASVKTAKTTWSEADWNVWADSTVSNCTSHVNSPQDAPSSFDPGSWIGTSTTPSLTVTSPSNNNVFSPETTSTDITLSVANFTVASGGTGDGYIKYSVNSGTAVDKFDISDISLSNLTAGSSYAVDVELVDNSGASLSPAVTASVSFSVAEYTTVANLSELRAGTEGNYYELTGEVVYTYEGTSRNQKFIQDNTAAILIDDDPGIITTSYTIGDGITGIKGRLGSFNGVTQFVPTVNTSAATSTGNQITPVVVTVAQMLSNLDDYESEFITINDVNFTAADGSATFSSGSNYDITDGTDTMVFRVHFTGTDIDGAVIPTSSANITGIAGEFNGTSQVFGIDLANIVLSTRYNEIGGFSLYPNPVTNGRLSITSNSSDNKQVSIFNVLGKNVLNTIISGTKAEVNTSEISAGIYILKVVEGGKTATSKLIIR